VIDEVAEDAIHEGLKGSGGVTEAKGHDEGLIETKSAFKGSFPFIAFPDLDVVITPSYVELGEIVGALEFVNKIGDQW
jgi:hypothetical protein